MHTIPLAQSLIVNVTGLTEYTQKVVNAITRECTDERNILLLVSACAGAVADILWHNTSIMVSAFAVELVAILPSWLILRFCK